MHSNKNSIKRNFIISVVWGVYNCVFRNDWGVLGQGPSKLALLSRNNSNELFATDESCQREVSEKP